ncbi:DUF3253 domain-containing protein [Mycobacterium parmense]|uniref:Uncharacterized protein n=1 Tax=Mycobacterium parmense TaxID=185642 RepID=A0A7I7YR91_9MYCO|nr:DUF3253 domain-containing protein [Mycobacterium parmense]MCV7349675.1 DUF3253 domain-containing protein [Mycobacterium parmense]ORW51867.1 hypothetical protein AWC20_22275 [Mycobacterium parmense]BBZ43674.1 hypothetical protein MPRM_09550 [Mycobacterium parmense]
MDQPLRAELRRIRDGGGAGSPDAGAALGDGPAERRLEAAMRALALHRGPGSSTCPSDAARAVGGEGWRGLMADARRLARDLARSGEVEITQRGAVLDPDGDWRGPVRIRAAR